MVTRREALGSWLEGTPVRSRGTGGLALPPDGPGSRARLGRRVVALAVDWVLSMGVAMLVVPPADPDALPLLSADPTATLAVFAASTWLFVGLFGTSVGHRLLGMRVTRLADLAVRRPPGLVAAGVRTVLLCLVIPAVVWDGDGRGMHDVGARTVLVRR